MGGPGRKESEEGCGENMRQRQVLGEGKEQRQQQDVNRGMTTGRTRNGNKPWQERLTILKITYDYDQ